MDCPFCFEAINEATGQVKTSCGHTFHFKCLNHWYYSQLQREEAQESCPCCRKEPGEFERASIVDDTTQEDVESETISEPSVDFDVEWVRVGPSRWIVPSNGTHRLQILAQVAEDQTKLGPYYIPPYDGEAHALWILRTLFEEPIEPPGPYEETHAVDRPKMLRRRRRSYGRTFWSHLGEAHNLKEIDGYCTD